MTARKVDVANTSWTQNAAKDWNLGGMHFSRDFGYGLLDVSAAVRLAESWTQPAGTVANWQSAQGLSSTASAAIPDNSVAGLTATAVVTDNVRIERMEFDLNLTAASPSQLSATITSPGGTTVTLFDQPLTRSLKDGAPDMATPESAWPQTFTVGATAFLGEASAGTWTLKLTDKVSGEIATFNSLTVRAWGSVSNADSQYVLTDEFSGAHTLTDTAGVDVVNAAAVAIAVRIDLSAGAKSTVGGGEFTIAASTVIENAIGGLGNDILIGNDAANQLRGNRGDDRLEGNGGIDTAVYQGAKTGYTLNLSGAIQTVRDNATLEGTDTLVGVERLKFSDFSVALDVSGNAGTTAKILGAVFGKDTVANKEFAGIGLQILDGGVSYLDLMQLAINAKLGAGASNAAVVNLLYTNVVGTPPPAGDLASFTGLLDSGAFTRASLGVLAADTVLNTVNVNLVGLATSGLEYLPWG